MLGSYFSTRGPGHLVQMHGIMEFTNKNRSNLNLTVSVRNRIMGRCWIFHQDSDQKQTSKLTQKCVTNHKTKLLPRLSPVPDLNPIENEWGEAPPTWRWNLKNLNWLCMREWFLISSQVFSRIIKHYRRKLRTVILAKGCCNNWEPIIVSNMNYGKTCITQWDFPAFSIVLLKWKVRILWMKNQKDKQCWLDR